jgi:hypothetical protein
MAGVSIRPFHAMGLLRWAALALLFIPEASSAASQDLAAAVSATTAQLRQGWAADPTTAVLPFPAIRLLPAGASVQGACSPQAPPRRPQATASYCASSGEVLLDQDLLADAFKAQPQRSAVLAYWIATALAERLLPGGDGVTTRAAASTLQANCLGGVLLGASPTRQASSDATALLIAARGAYGDSNPGVVGSASQRGYALLSGLGATASSCSAAEMAALAKGTVPDPNLLQRIEQLPPPERAHGSLLGAINSQCQALPNKPCPRKFAPSSSLP